MNRSRLMKLERVAAMIPAAKRSEKEAEELLDCLTDHELESMFGAKVPPATCGKSYAAKVATPASVASYAVLAEVIFSVRPDLLDACRIRLAQRRGSVEG
jgi:hypothetical protein